MWLIQYTPGGNHFISADLGSAQAIVAVSVVQGAGNARRQLT